MVHSDKHPISCDARKNKIFLQNHNDAAETDGNNCKEEGV